MKIYIWSKKEKQMLNYDAKQIDDFGTIIRITFYNGNEIIIPNYEEETGQEIEFDVIGLCCDYVEYKDIKEFQQDYNNDYKTIEDVEAETTVIMIDDESFIIQVF